MADPTPPEPIRERILQDCEQSLWQIDGSGDYHHALVDVRRGKPVPEDLAELPVAFFDEGDETVAKDTGLLLTRTLPLTVEARLRSADGDLPTQTNRMLADVERALTTDPTRGGLALLTNMTGNSVVKDEAPGVLASVRVDFEIQYWTRWGDPASTG